MTPALVTIGMTTYNAAETVARAVRSARDQNYSHVEIVVVDDASTDTTWEILNTLKESGPVPLTLFRNEKNEGVAVTRNRLIDQASGDFIVFFDDDDESLPDRVSAQIAAIERYEQNYAQGAPVICHTARTQIFPDGTTTYIGTMGCVGDNIPAPSYHDVARAILFNDPVPGGNGAMATCSQAARVSTYRACRGFDPSFRRSEDTEFCLRLALAGGHFIGLETPFVRQHMTSAADKKIHDERVYALKIYQKHEPFLIAENRGHFDCDWLEMKHDYLERKTRSFFCRLMRLIITHPVLSIRKICRALPNYRASRQLRTFHEQAKSS